MVLQVTSYNIMHLVVCASISVGVLSASFAPPAGVAQAQGATRKMNGFEVSGRFLEEWSRQGSDQSSIYVNGLPITSRRAEISMEDGRSYETQWFERARYELHPGNQKPYDVLLGRLGVTSVEGRGRVDPATGRAANPADQPFVGIDKPADADGKSKVWFVETKHTISGRILEYWNRYGGLPQFGFPLSEPFQEVSQADGKAYMVQYFERNRMELHPEKATPYEVELGLLGVEQHKQTPTTADMLPITPPQGVKSARDVIRVISTQEPPNLTIFSNALVTSRMRALVEDSITSRDENENVFPKLAWYVPTLENGGARFIGTGDDRYLQVKYKLRQGVRWSDGKEVTSNDALFHYKLVMRPDAPVAGRGDYTRLKNAHNPDKYTVVYNFMSLKQVRDFYNAIPNKQDYGFLRVFIELSKPVISITYSEVGDIYPEHVLQNIAPNKIPEHPFARAPIGTGPYKVVRWIAGQEIIFEQNEQYNLTSKPLLKRIEVRFVDDSNGGLAKIKLSDTDLITSESFNAQPDATFAQELKRAGLSVVSRPAASWEHIDFQFDYAPFKDRAVREAIITGINRQAIINKVYAGTSAIMNGPVPPMVYHSLENPAFSRKYPDVAARYKLPVYQYNPDRAAQLLEAAGWKCPKGNTNKNCDGGIREKNGVKLSFEYGTTIQITRQQIQGLVQADLKAIGVDAQTKAYPANVFFNDPGPRSNGATKLAQFGWVGSQDSDFSAWLCDSIYNPATDSGVNYQHYCNHALDAANARFITDLDPKVQVPGSAEAQVTLMADIVIIPLAQRPNIEAVSTGLANYKLTNSQVTSFWNARQWYFK